jgi:hypothetical protein
MMTNDDFRDLQYNMDTVRLNERFLDHDRPTAFSRPYLGYSWENYQYEPQSQLGPYANRDVNPAVARLTSAPFADAIPQPLSQQQQQPPSLMIPPVPEIAMPQLGQQQMPAAPPGYLQPQEDNTDYSYRPTGEQQERPSIGPSRLNRGIPGIDYWDGPHTDSAGVMADKRRLLMSNSRKDFLDEAFGQDPTGMFTPAEMFEMKRAAMRADRNRRRQFAQ